VTAGSRNAGTAAHDRRALTFLALVAALLVASFVCASIVEVRNHYADDTFFRFLDWNLFLAWIPVVLAFLVYESVLAGHPVAATGLGVVWLLFFPNAPYMLTDFIHLRESPSTPLWYDGLMLSAFAWTSLVLGFLSLYLMQIVWRRAAGPIAAWAGVAAALALASVGVYIGRFIHFNSWDALLHPRRVAHVIDSHLVSPADARLAGALLVLTGCLTAAYAVFYTFAGLRLELERGRGAPGACRRTA
jgi:uncharacterized membrane protein